MRFWLRKYCSKCQQLCLTEAHPFFVKRPLNDPVICGFCPQERDTRMHFRLLPSHIYVNSTPKQLAQILLETELKIIAFRKPELGEQYIGVNNKVVTARIEAEPSFIRFIVEPQAFVAPAFWA